MFTTQKIALGLFVSFFSFAASADQSGPRILVVPVTAGWKHAATDVVLMPNLAGFQRIEISDFGQKEDDIFSTYRQSSTSTDATVYIFHASIANVPIWYDRIASAISSRSELGTVNLAATQPTAFAPKGQDNKSGLRMGADLTGKAFTGTGVSLLPVNGWLVVVRMTSQTLKGDAIDAALKELVEAIRLPAKQISGETAVPLVACGDALATKTAKQVKPDMSDAFMGSILSSIPADEIKPATPPVKPPTYCRDASSTSSYGVYRPDGSKDQYVVALGDAGVSIIIGENTSLASLLRRKGQRVTMTVGYLDHDDVYTSFSSLPSPAQVVGVMDSQQPISRSDRNGNITISVTK